jgi:hypothetical protein
LIIEKVSLESFRAFFEEIFKGDLASIKFCLDLLEVAHVWDDLVDKDNRLTSGEINRVFITAIFGLQNYPLWFSAGLNHLVLNSFLKWRDANEIENNPLSSDDDLSKSYMLRAGLYDVFAVIAYHLYGDEWAREVGPKIRLLYGEKLKDYILEMRSKNA